MRTSITLLAGLVLAAFIEAPAQLGAEAIDPFWTTQSGTTGVDVAKGMALANGMLVVGGYTAGEFANNSSLGDDDAFLAWYDLNGVQQGQVTQFGTGDVPLQLAYSDSVQDIGSDAHGNIYVTGTTEGEFSDSDYDNPDTARNYDGFVAKYDANRTLVWLRQYGATAGAFSRTTGWAIAVDSVTGDSYVTGFTDGNLSGTASETSTLKAYVRKYNADGDDQWTMQFTDMQRGHGLALGPNSELYVTGYNNGSPTYDARVTKIDTSDQTVAWSTLFSSDGIDQPENLAVDSAGDVYVAGLTNGELVPESVPQDDDAFLFKLKGDDGSVLQQLQFGEVGQDYAGSLAIENDVIYMNGVTTSGLDGVPSSGGLDLFTDRYSTDLTLLGRQQWGTSNRDVSSGLVVQEGRVFVAGKTDGAFPGYTNQGPSDFFVTEIPEPSTYALLLLGVSCVPWTRARRGKRYQA